MAGNFVQFRVDSDLAADLDEWIEAQEKQDKRVKISRSSAARTLIRTALGDSIAKNAAAEALMSTLAAQKRVIARVNELIAEELPRLLAQEGLSE